MPSISTESFYASLFANLGYIGATLVIAMLLGIFVYSFLARDFCLLIVLLVIVCSSATVVLTEVYPSNML